MRALAIGIPTMHSVRTTGTSLTHFQMSKLLNQVVLGFDSKTLNFLLLITESIIPVTCSMLPLAQSLV